MNKNEMYAKFVPPVVDEFIGEVRSRYFVCNSLMFAAGIAVGVVVANKFREHSQIAHLPEEIDKFLIEQQPSQSNQGPNQEAA